MVELDPLTQFNKVFLSFFLMEHEVKYLDSSNVSAGHNPDKIFY